MSALGDCPGCGHPLHALADTGPVIECPACGRGVPIQTLTGIPATEPEETPVAGAAQKPGLVASARQGLAEALKRSLAGDQPPESTPTQTGVTPLSENSEVETESWGSRLAKSFFGVLVGIVLFLVSFPLLFWNEGRAVQTARSLEEGARAVIPANLERIDPAADGKLVHLTGMAQTAEMLGDPEFGVAVNAIRLRRLTEVYHWKEEKETKKQKKPGGGQETVTTYNYKKVWSNTIYDSGAFHNQEGHQNPARKPFEDQTRQAQQVTVGAFTLSPGLIKQMTNEERLPAAAPSGGRALPPRVKVDDGLFYQGDDPVHPAVGDARIEFKVVRPATVSIVARQAGKQLDPYPTRAGDAIELLEAGVHGPDEMFQMAHSRNALLTWALRVAGLALMAGGILLVFQPLVVVADVVPVVGNFLGAGLWVFSAVVALALGLVTIGVAWAFYRPLIGVPLLLVAAAGLAGLSLAGRRKRAAAPKSSPVNRTARTFTRIQNN